MFSFSIVIILILHCLHSNFVVWCTLLCIQNTRQLQTHFEVNCWISMKCLEFSSNFFLKQYYYIRLINICYSTIFVFFCIHCEKWFFIQIQSTPNVCFQTKSLSSYWMRVAIFVSQVLLQIIPYKLTLYFITHKYTHQIVTFIRYSAEQKATKNRIFIKKNFCPKKNKNSTVFEQTLETS